MITKGQLEYIVKTIEAIIRSEHVAEYLIGYTATPLFQRSAAYRTQGYHHLVALATHLNRNQALDLERRLQDRAKGDKAKLLYQKYSEIKRDMPYSPSAGGRKDGADLNMHTVYMAWVEA